MSALSVPLLQLTRITIWQIRSISLAKSSHVMFFSSPLEPFNDANNFNLENILTNLQAFLATSFTFINLDITTFLISITDLKITNLSKCQKSVINCYCFVHVYLTSSLAYSSPSFISTDKQVSLEPLVSGDSAHSYLHRLSFNSNTSSLQLPPMMRLYLPLVLWLYSSITLKLSLPW